MNDRIPDDYEKDPVNTEAHRPSDKQLKEMRAMQLGEHKGTFYFKRAFLTAFAIMTAVSAFIAAWMLIWALIAGGLFALGNQDGGEEGSSYEPTSQTTDELGDPSPMPSGDEATCGWTETEPC
jgi:hypothetical protein